MRGLARTSAVGAGTRLAAETSSAAARHSAALVPWVVPLALAAAWEAGARLGALDTTLAPPLSAILARAATLAASGRLLGDLAASGWRVVVGFAAASLTAIPLGVALGLSPRLEAYLAPLVGALRPLAPPAWIPLAILWFGIGDAPAVFIIVVGTFSSLLPGTLAAVKGIDPEAIKAAMTLGASRRQVLAHVLLPSLLPDLMAQLRLGMGLAWMCVIAAEMVAVRRGVGFMMIEARHLFRTEDVLVGMLVVAAVGLGVDRGLLQLEARLCGWRQGLEPWRVFGRGAQQ